MVNTPAPPVPSPEAPPAGPAAPRGRTARALDWGYRHGSALLLVPVLCLAAFTAYIPHRNYPYALHVDEWANMTQANSILRARDLTYPEPYQGVSLSTPSSNLEIGFPLFWGLFEDISGIEWMAIFRYFPSLVFMMVILAVFIFARKFGFGWESAFFASLVPTTVGILGPSFLVSISLGMFIVILALSLVFFFKGVSSYITLFILTSALLTIHSPSAIVLVLLVLPFCLLSLKKNRTHGLFTILSILFPFLLSIPWMRHLIPQILSELFTPQQVPDYVQVPAVIQTYGVVIYIVCLCGIMVLALKGTRRNYSLLFGFLLLVLMLVSLFVFHFGIAILYERGLLYMMLMTGITAGAFLGFLNGLHTPKQAAIKPFVLKTVRAFGITVCAVLVIVSLVTVLPIRYKQPYYHMIDSRDYAAFIWIRDNLSPSYSLGVLDPVKATSFTAITGRYAYARIHAFTTIQSDRAYLFLNNDSSATAFLTNYGISFVYTTRPVNNPDLVEVHPDVYLLEE